VGPARPAAHDDKPGSAQVLRQPFRSEARSEIPASLPRPATLVVAQGIRQGIGDFLGRRGREISERWSWGMF
jgi:hypothetical protein